MVTGFHRRRNLRKHAPLSSRRPARTFADESSRGRIRPDVVNVLPSRILYERENYTGGRFDDSPPSTGRASPSRRSTRQQSTARGHPPLLWHAGGSRSLGVPS